MGSLLQPSALQLRNLHISIPHPLPPTLDRDNPSSGKSFSARETRICTSWRTSTSLLCSASSSPFLCLPTTRTIARIWRWCLPPSPRTGSFLQRSAWACSETPRHYNARIWTLMRESTHISYLLPRKSRTSFQRIYASASSLSILIDNACSFPNRLHLPTDSLASYSTNRCYALSATDKKYHPQRRGNGMDYDHVWACRLTYSSNDHKKRLKASGMECTKPGELGGTYTADFCKSFYLRACTYCFDPALSVLLSGGIIPVICLARYLLYVIVANHYP